MKRRNWWLVCLIPCSIQGFPLCRRQLEKNRARLTPLSLASADHSRPFAHIQGIIFDIDGTLVDSWKLGFDATQVVLNKYKIPLITHELYHECTRYATPERLARHAGLVPGDLDFETVGAQLAQEFDDLYVGLVSVETAGFFDNVKDFLEKIPAHVSLGALTNAAERYGVAVLQVNCPAYSLDKSSGGVYGRFQSIRGADTVPQPKPSPEGLWQVCRDLNLQPTDCVYIGDSPTDAVAAEAAGMASIGVLWGSHGESSLAKAPFAHLCQSVQELEQLLQ